MKFKFQHEKTLISHALKQMTDGRANQILLLADSVGDNNTGFHNTQKLSNITNLVTKLALQSPAPLDKQFTLHMHAYLVINKTVSNLLPSCLPFVSISSVRY
jgi:DeoR/GlpR family transcriptional regulator of sugar metabolism